MNIHKKIKQNSRREFVKKTISAGLGAVILPDFLVHPNTYFPGTEGKPGIKKEFSIPAGEKDEGVSKVSGYKATFTSPPKMIPTRKTVDGPIIGNGDLGVVLSGPPEKQRFWISKNDFWKAKPVYPNAGPRPIGGIEIDIPALVSGSYHVEQILENGTIISRFTTALEVEDPPPYTKIGTTVMIRSWIPSSANFLIIELSVEGEQLEGDLMSRVLPSTWETPAVGVDTRLWVATGDEAETSGGNMADGYWMKRRFSTPDASISLEQKPLAWDSEAAVAMRLLNHRKLPLPCLPGIRGDGWCGDRFIIDPGCPVTIVAAIVTSEESDNPLNAALEAVRKVEMTTLDGFREVHEKWWNDFWSKSSVEIGDPLIEKFWYGSHYIMACCSRNKRFPPNLYGNWVTTDSPSWEGHYTLNYNYQAPYWGVYSSNHVELSDPYDVPLLEYLPIAKENAPKYLNINGAYYDVGIGPKGLVTSYMPDGCSPPGEGDHMFLGQKSDAVFASANMFMRFYSTYDLDYAKIIYPFLIAVADFWEGYLKFEGNRYVIANDAFGEVWDGGFDKNNCNSLGFLRMFFKGMLDMSHELKSDTDRRSKWEHILKYISEFPTVEVNGKRRIRNAEAGPSAGRTGVLNWGLLGIVFPSGVTGLGSDPAFLKILRDDMNELPEKNWINTGPGFNQIFPSAVRIGINPQVILARLVNELIASGMPNLFVYTAGGGIENCSGVPSTINEMLLQSHEGLLRLFPVWPEDRDAKFENLRAYGAFLVSSSKVNGKVEYVKILSEKGRKCSMRNPWPGGQAQIKRENGKTEKMTGDQFTFKTSIGEKILMVQQ